MQLNETAKQELDSALSRSGLRSTRQREQVYATLYENKDHPTADETYAIVKKELPSISLATVYNCLETLVECNLIREVNLGRHPTRYEPVRDEHGHFFCQDCGKVFDIQLSDPFLNELKNILPKGFQAESVQLSFKGIAECEEDEERCEELAVETGLSQQTLR